MVLSQLEYALKQFLKTKDLQEVNLTAKKNKMLRFVDLKNNCVFLHLCTFKTPTSWAIMSCEDDADCEFSMRNGVKKIIRLSDQEQIIILTLDYLVFEILGIHPS